MKQIIVNVSGLTTEEKQRVNEALAKITGARKIPLISNSAGWFFAPVSPLGAMMVTWGPASLVEKPTHTPQQVLEMAGMAEKRKVRADFDPKQPISVDVSNCTEEEREEVQQAFFDVGIEWLIVGIGRQAEEVANFRHLDAGMYTNSTSTGMCPGNLMYGTSPRTDSISHRQFLSMVYEADQQGHIHADLMAQYAEDAKTTDKPWKNFQWSTRDGKWLTMQKDMQFESKYVFRRKPKTHIVNGVEVPDLRFVPCDHQYFYKPEPYARALVAMTTLTRKSRSGEDMIRHNLCYEHTEAGKQAAILHTKAWLGIA